MHDYPGRRMMDTVPLKNITDPPGTDERDEPVDRPYPDDTVGPGRQVTLNFELALADGAVVDSNFGKPPVTFTVGDGNLPGGFEAALVGLGEGAEQVVRLQPEQAFGPWNEDNVRVYPRYQFPADLALDPGLMINFADAAGNEQAGVVVTADAASAKIDFNHPLAGKVIDFKVHIRKIHPKVPKG